MIQIEKRECKNNHVRYTHTFNCEMCGVISKTLDNLETHTRDKYERGRFNLTLKTVSDVKNHCKLNHRNGVDIFNFKFDRKILEK